MTGEVQYELKVLLGVEEIKQVEFRMTGERGKFFIETDFVRLGPIDTEQEATRLLGVANQSVRNII